MKITNPHPIFLDAQGYPLDAGFVYIGQAHADPQAIPLSTFFDADLSIPAQQPLRTLGGVIVDGNTPKAVFVAEEDYSIRVADAGGDTVSLVPTIADTRVDYQPLDSDLTAIAALTTTAFGRALLTAANQAALQAAVGLPAALAATGGTVTGNITRGGAGPHLYHGDAAMASGKITVSAVGGGNPTTADGEIWLGI